MISIAYGIERNRLWYKLHIREFWERAGKRVYFIFAFRSELPIVEHLKEAREAWEDRRRK